MSKKEDYEVGYCKPPKKGQFQKGESGNPSGRKRGSENFATILNKELDEFITIQNTGEQITKKTAIIKKTVADAAQGKDRARELIFEKFAHEFTEEKMKRESSQMSEKDLARTMNILSDEELDAYIAIQKKMGDFIKNVLKK